MLRFLLLALFLSACAGKWEEDKTLNWSAEEIYQYAKAEFEAENYETAAKYYQKVKARFPRDILAQQSALDMAYSYHKALEPEKALVEIEQFIKTYPRHPRIDYAYYMRGVIAYERGYSFFKRINPTNLSQSDPEILRKAFYSFEELLKLFPESQYADDARNRMIYIRNLLAQHELEIAEFYIRRKAFVAALNRAQTVVINYQLSPSTPYALSLMVYAYKQMGDERRASETYAILERNFPTLLNSSEVQAYLNGKVGRLDTLFGVISNRMRL